MFCCLLHYTYEHACVILEIVNQVLSHCVLPFLLWRSLQRRGIRQCVVLKAVNGVHSNAFGKVGSGALF